MKSKKAVNRIPPCSPDSTVESGLYGGIRNATTVYLLRVITARLQATQLGRHTCPENDEALRHVLLAALAVDRRNLHWYKGAGGESKEEPYP